MPGRDSHILFDSLIARITRVRTRSGALHGSDSTVTERSSGHRLVLPIEGSFLASIDRQQILIDPAATLLINGGEPYRLELVGARGFTALVFALKAFDKTSTRHFSKHVSFFAASTHLAISQALCGPSLRQRCDRVTLDLFTSCVAESARRGAALPAPVERCRRVLTRPDTEPPANLAELARQAHSTRYHLTRSFRRATGWSLQQYRNHLRLVRSLREVGQSVRTLSTIALDAGFASPSHFSTAFRTHFGISPSALRCAMQQESESAAYSD